PRAACHMTLLLTDPPTPEIYTLSLPDALPISRPAMPPPRPARRLAPAPRPRSSPPASEGRRANHRGPSPSARRRASAAPARARRSEEHTSELQSRGHLVCRLLLEKKKTVRQLR